MRKILDVRCWTESVKPLQTCSVIYGDTTSESLHQVSTVSESKLYEVGDIKLAGVLFAHRLLLSQHNTFLTNDRKQIAWGTAQLS